jgi:hypothetical protein
MLSPDFYIAAHAAVARGIDCSLAMRSAIEPTSPPSN